jgi:hypothetical protein
MQRWEYLTVKLEVTGFNNSTLAPQSVNGQMLNDWKKIPLHEYISLLGADGWEMTGTTNIIYGSGFYFLFFKRPRP